MTIPAIDMLAILPQTIVIVTALLVLLVDAAAGQARIDRQVLPWLSLLGLAAAAAAAVWLSLSGQPHYFQEMAVADGYSLTVMLVILLTAGLGVLLAQATVPHISHQAGAYYGLLLLSAAGMMFMGAALDLLVVFLALEILSLALYVLVGFNRAEARSAEASLKYFLLGAFSSGFFLYGIALVYGATASTNLEAIGAALAQGTGASASQSLYLYAGVAMLLIGFGFKIAMAPFHMWTPDAYQGAPTPVTGFMSVATKAAAFGAFMRVFVIALPAAQPQWSWALAILATLTMTLGNLAALRQSSLKRMLAYSSIAHAGYALVGLVPGTSQGVSAVLFYLFSYVFMNLGAFAVVTALERLGENDVLNGNFAGLADRRPALAAAMAIFMFSLAGIPPFVGFFAKFFVFSAAMAEGWGWLVLVGVLNSVLSAFYYLSVTVQMYFRKADETPAVAEAAGKSKPGLRRAEGKGKKGAAAPAAAAQPAETALALSTRSLSVAVFIAALGTVAVGLWPAPWTQWISQAVTAVFGG
ncbi:MAG TPA: NADH-quinone oxidoreductase subunit N [Anaerolineae bacterium]|nr:NADH-quinone oxidoreductase subunit N [Anaerolineae bacterium]HNU05449.1 NADH-quinone oxidoreductase subunit N [Anaerolineae bacterium]